MLEKEAIKKEFRKAMLKQAMEKKANPLALAGHLARGVGGWALRNPTTAFVGLPGALGTLYGGYKAYQGINNFFNRQGAGAGGQPNAMNMRNQLLNQNQLANPGMQKQNSEKRAANVSVLKALLGKTRSFGEAARRAGGKPYGGVVRNGPKTRLGQMVPELGGGKINEGIHDAIVSGADLIAPAVGGAGRFIADNPGATLAGGAGIGLGGLAMALSDKKASVSKAVSTAAKVVGKSKPTKQLSPLPVKDNTSIGSFPGKQFAHLRTGSTRKNMGSPMPMGMKPTPEQAAKYRAQEAKRND